MSEALTLGEARDHARFVWTDSAGSGRNRYALFRRALVLSGDPAAAVIHLFADTRYRLIVNGRTVGHGPARFFPSHPVYDTWNIAGQLHRGENVIAVIVNSYDCISFHSEPSRGGLIARCEVSDTTGAVTRIVTDESWRCIESPGHDADTLRITFALNPGEHIDLGKMPAGWDAPGFDDRQWPAATFIGDPGHWGRLHPRPIPLLDESPVKPLPRRGLWAAAAADDNEVFSLFAKAATEGHFENHGRVAVMTFLHSPKAQRATFGAWWGRYWMNGQALQGTPRKDLSLRQDFTADLKAGWNTLFVYETTQGGAWNFHLSLPRNAGLSLSADRTLGGDATFLIGGPWLGDRVASAEAARRPPAAPGDLPPELGPWQRWPRGRSVAAPCRERAWKVFRQIEAAEACRDGDTLAMLYDFGHETLGRARLDFTAAAGTKVDVAYTERLKPDGSADIHNRYFVEMVERCTSREGRQTWHLFHPRGFRYLEVSVTGDLRRFELHNVDVTGAYYPVQRQGSFECSDERVTRIWGIGQEALHNCMEDAYLDCPWRERGTYVGDVLVEYAANLAVFGDHALMRRSIALFLEGQGENGLIRGGAFGLPPGIWPDYSTILPQCARRYAEASGDASIAADYVDNWLRLADGLRALRIGSGDLFDGSSQKPYVDMPQQERRYGLNCILNCFSRKALADLAWLFEKAGREDLAGPCRDQAARTAEAVRRAFWDEGRGLFVDHLRDQRPDTGPSVQGNALAILYGIAAPEQERRIEPWLVAGMANNLSGQGSDGVRVDAYASYYALGALYKLGRRDEALRFMRDCWGHMLDRGAWTTWEFFDADQAGTSLCHAWAASPCWYLSTQVLGVSFPEPGRYDRIAIRPNPSGLEWARGVFPTAKGPSASRGAPGKADWN